MAASKETGSSTACVNVFPPRANTGLGLIWLPRNVLKPIDRSPLCKTHVVKSIETFDYSKFDTVIKSVKEHGGISFVSNKREGALSILEAIKSIVREYRYSSLFQFNTYNNRSLHGKDDDLLSILSFFDFIHCVPMFNLKKVDGMGISFTQVVRKRSELEENQIQTFRTDIVVSNYEDNLFVIDGTIIDQKYKVDNSLYKTIKSCINTDLPINKGELKLKKKKQQSIDRADKFYISNNIVKEKSGGFVGEEPIENEAVEVTPTQHSYTAFVTSDNATSTTTY